MNQGTNNEKKTMRCMESFEFYDYTGIVERLEQRARQGWLLKKRGAFFWTYEEIEPQNLRFAVTYQSGLSESQPGISSGRQAAYQLYIDDDWELLTSWNQMLIFVSKKENPRPMEINEAVRQDAIHSTAKKSYLFTQLLLGLIFLFNLMTHITPYLGNLSQLLLDKTELAVILLDGLVVSFVLLHVCRYHLWRERGKKALAQGLPCPAAAKGYGLIRAIYLVLLVGFIGLFLYGNYENGDSNAGFWVACLLLALCIFTSQKLKAYMKKRGVSRPVIRLITSLYIVVFCIVMFGVVLMVIAFPLFEL